MWSIKTLDLSWLVKTFQSPCTIVVKRVKSLVGGNPSYQTYSHQLRTPQRSSSRLHQQSLRVLPKPPGPEVALVSPALSTTFYISLSHASQSYQFLHLKVSENQLDFKLLMEYRYLRRRVTIGSQSWKSGSESLDKTVAIERDINCQLCVLRGRDWGHKRRLSGVVAQEVFCYGIAVACRSYSGGIIFRKPWTE